MATYRMPNGVLVDIPEEKAARIAGISPADDAPPTPRRGVGGRKPKAEQES